MPHGKPAGVPCVQLTAELQCSLFGRPERPACCSGLSPSEEMCGTSRHEALAWLTELEQRALELGIEALRAQGPAAKEGER